MKYLHEDGTPFTKEEFLQKLKTDKEFNNEFGNKGIDQISDLIKQLKENPDSRRLLVSAWNPSDLPHQVLPPCHYGFQVYTRELSIEERVIIFNQKKEKGEIVVPEFNSVGDANAWTSKLLDNDIPTRAISLMWNQRSVDTFLGLPFNIASYGLLLEIIAKAVNMVPDQLIGNLGDTHLYSNHIEQAKEQIGRELRIDERVCMCYENPKLDLTRIQEGMSDDEFKSVCDEFNIPTRTREPYPLPKLIVYESYDASRTNGYRIPFDELTHESIRLIDYQSHGTIKAPLSN